MQVSSCSNGDVMKLAESKIMEGRNARRGRAIAVKEEDRVAIVPVVGLADLHELCVLPCGMAPEDQGRGSCGRVSRIGLSFFPFSPLHHSFSL